MFLRKKRSSSVARRTTSLTNRLASTRGRRLGFEPLEDRNLLSVTWCGGHGTNWTTGANWVGGVAPTAGADLVFSGANTATYDDFVDGTSFRSIELASNNFSLAGNRAQLTSNITVDNNVTGSTISMTVQPTSASPLSINLNGAGSGLTISGVLFSGSGGITKSGTGLLTLSGVNSYGGPTKITGGTLVLGNASAMQSSTLDYNSYGGTLSFGTLTAATLGGLQGNQTLPLTNNNSAGVTLNVGAIGGTITYGGVLSGAGSLVKSGSGTLTLTGASTYGGSTTVQNGTLAVGVDNALPQTTTVTLGYNALSGILQVSDATTGHNQTLAGLYTSGTGLRNCVTANGGNYPMLTLNIASGTDTYGGVLGDLAGWGAEFSIAKTGAGTLSLTNTSTTYPNDYMGNTTLSGGTLSFSSIVNQGNVYSALGWSYCIIADGGTLQWASGNTQDVTAGHTLYIMPGKTAILDTNGNDVTLAGSIAQGDTATVGLTKTGAGKLTFTSQAVFAGNVTLSQGTLDVGGSDPQTGAARADTISAASLTLTSGSTYKAELTDAACGQIDVTGKVTLGSATLSVNNTGTTNTYGVVRVLIRNGGADPVVGTFSGLGEGAQVTAGGVPYFITYRYNAEAGTFANGNDVAICSALVDVPAVPAAPALVASAHYDTIDDNFKDAARHLESSTTAKYITQYQLPDVSTLLYNSAYFAHPGGSTWPDNTEYVRYSSEDTAIATVNATSGLVTFVIPGTARILVTVYQGGTNTTSYKTNLEMRLTGAYTGGDTTTVVARYTPNTFVAANNLLVLYNADLAASVDLKNYYLAQRPGVSGANLLGITGINSYTTNYGHDVNSTGFDMIVSQVQTWMANHPNNQIRYIVGLCGLPSRRNEAGTNSLLYGLYSTLGGLSYTGTDHFTASEYGAPLITWLDCGDNYNVNTPNYPNTKAFIDKERNAATTNSGRGLRADGLTISGAAAGVGGTTWVMDNTTTYGCDFFGSFRNALLGEGVSDANINFQSSFTGPPISAATDPTAYGCWGTHNGYWGYQWPVNNNITFTNDGHAGWWVGMSVESYNGIYNGATTYTSWQADPTEFFAANAFGGSNYSNTPVCFVGHTAEPGLYGVNGPGYFARWADGWSSIEAAWASRITANFLVVTDIGLVRSAPSLSATASSSSQINLSWNAMPSGTTSIKVYRAPDVGGHAGTFALINTLGPTATTYSDPGRTDGTKYWYYVEAYINPTTSEYSNYNAATTTLLAPTALTATAVSSSEIDLNWTNNSATATDYLIERSTDNGTYWSQIFDSTPASVHAYNNYSLSAGTGYWYRVRAYNSAAGIYSTYVASASAATWLSVPSSLVGYWRFDENGGATAYDTATAGSTADNVTLSSASWQNQNASKLGNSLNFNGNGYLYTAANPADLNITGQLTLACWAKSGSSGNWSGSGSGSGIGTFFSKGSAYSLGASSSSGTTVQFQATIAGTSRSVSYPATGIDSWHYYTGTYDGTNLRLYVDGVLRATSPSYTGAIASNTSAAWMGNTLYGSLDEMRVYNTVISQNDITALGGQGYTSVKYLTVANSLAAAFYHEQDYAFGATNVYQYGDRQSTFSLPAQYRGSTLIQTANADNQSTTFSMSFATSAPCAVYVLYDNAITSPASWLTQQFTSTGQTVVNSDGHTFTIYKSIRAAGKIYLGANGGNVNSQMYTVLLMPLCWNGTDNKVS